MSFQQALMMFLSSLMISACDSRLPTSANHDPDVGFFQLIEKERLQSLIDADMMAADRFHSDDFELVSPSGRVYTKEQYLGGISSGIFDYQVFEPVSDIQVKVHVGAAVLRYRSTIEITVGEQSYPPASYWHISSLELRDGQWQVVWSQSTAIAD